MSSTAPQPLNGNHPNPSCVIDASARWLDDEDLVLGCECANPALQIERWDQETAGVHAVQV